MSEPTITFTRLTEGPATTRHADRTALAIASTGRGWRELARDIEAIPPGVPSAELKQHLARSLRAAASARPDLDTPEQLDVFNLLLPLAEALPPAHPVADAPVLRVLLEVEDVALRRILQEVVESPRGGDATVLTSTTVVFPEEAVPDTLSNCPRAAVRVDCTPGTQLMQEATLESGAWSARVPLPGWAVHHHPDTPPDAVHSWFDFIDMARCFARFGHVQ